MNERYSFIIEYNNTDQYDIHWNTFNTYEEAEAEAKAACESDSDYIYYVVKLIPCAKVYVPNPNVAIEKL